jgi:hypothetical protein
LKTSDGNGGLYDYFVDAEYNRKQEGQLKTILNNQQRVINITCDLILHSRGRSISSPKVSSSGSTAAGVSLIRNARFSRSWRLGLRLPKQRSRLMCARSRSRSKPWLRRQRLRYRQFDACGNAGDAIAARPAKMSECVVIKLD